jgi:hypothetical protein
MASVPLAAPVTFLGSTSGGLAGVSPATGLILPAAEATVLTGFTGWSVPNNGTVMVRLVVGAAGAGNVTLAVQRISEGQASPGLVIAVANSTTYLWGPFSQADFNDINGLLQFTISVVTGNSVGAYQLPPNMIGK